MISVLSTSQAITAWSLENTLIGSFSGQVGSLLFAARTISADGVEDETVGEQRNVVMWHAKNVVLQAGCAVPTRVDLAIFAGLRKVVPSDWSGTRSLVFACPHGQNHFVRVPAFLDYEKSDETLAIL